MFKFNKMGLAFEKGRKRAIERSDHRAQVRRRQRERIAREVGADLCKIGDFWVVEDLMKGGAR